MVEPPTQRMFSFSYFLIDAFHETIMNNGAINRLISKLENDDDVRTEAVKALLALATRRLSSTLSL